MKLEPVFLVRPEPPPPTVSRRALLLAVAGAFVTGASCGIGGLELLSSDAPAAARDESHETARRLAEGPIDELARHHRLFLMQLSSHPHDAVLWHGARRLVLYALEVGHSDSNFIVRALARIIERAPASASGHAEELERRVDELRHK